MRRALVLLVLAGGGLLAPSTAQAVVAAQGQITGQGTTWQLAVRNTGDQTIQCLRFTAANGVTITGASGEGNPTVASDGRSFGAQGADMLAAGATKAWSFTTTAEYPANAGGQLNVSADCVADFAGEVSGPPPPDNGGGGGPGPAGPQPVVGTTEVASVVSGTVLVRTPGSKRFRRLTTSEALPDGTEVDATKGTVRLTLAQPGGGTETADASEGRFIVDQDNGNPAITTLKLSEPLTGCSAKAAAAAKPKKAKKKRRQIFVSTKGGRVRTQGRYAAAIATGTQWRTIDRCTSTTVQVVEGTVQVTDLRRRTSAPLTAPGRRVVRRG